MSSVNIIDNSNEVRDKLERAVERAMISCGIVAEGYAKMICPVDTGRLRGSIVYVTSTKHSSGDSPAEAPDYTPRGTPEKGEVYIGTNVEYAIYVELGTIGRQAKSFLRPAVENHINEYKRLIEDELRGGR